MQLDSSDPHDRKIRARQIKVALDAGREGLDRAAVTRGEPDLEGAYDEGASVREPVDVPADAETYAGPSAWQQFRTMGPGWQSAKPSSPARPPARMADAGGFLTGLALYTVVVIYLRYGPAGWKGWLSAKFLNKPMAPAASASGSKPTTTSGGKAAV